MCYVRVILRCTKPNRKRGRPNCLNVNQHVFHLKDRHKITLLRTAGCIIFYWCEGLNCQISEISVYSKGPMMGVVIEVPSTISKINRTLYIYRVSELKFISFDLHAKCLFLIKDYAWVQV